MIVCSHTMSKTAKPVAVEYICAKVDCLNDKDDDNDDYDLL